MTLPTIQNHCKISEKLNEIKTLWKYSNEINPWRVKSVTLNPCGIPKVIS